jgi:hypothetical protein
VAEYTHDDAEKASGPKPGSDEAILAELKERFDYASVQWAEIIKEADIDVRYSAGHTFDAADLAVREGRLTVELDQLSQYTNQLVNSYRQNPRGAKVSPAGGGATEASAQLRANRIRQIEYESHAQEVYTVAGENAATRGYGYARIIAEWEDADSQALRLKAIPNPNQVLPDPDAESTSGADWNYLFFVHTITKAEFKRDYPDAQIRDFTPEQMALAPKWFGKDGRIQIAEYWYVTETPPTNGKGKPTRTVCMYLTNGVELLAKKGFPKKTEWRGSSIPFASCFGKIIYQTDPVTGDNQKMLQSYIRLARDAAKAYNWTASSKLEALALPVKASLFAYEGQLDNVQIGLVERATREHIPLITAKATTEATGPQNILPLPQYGTRAPDISGYEIAGESFRRDIQNALGRYSAQDHRLGSTKVTSGVALKELDKSGDLGSYHFVAHYDDFIRELAVKLNELLPFYDDASKEVSTRLPDGTTQRVQINTPTARDPKGAPMYGPDDLKMDPNERHAVTISTGPSFDSQRAEGKDAALTLLQNPVAFPIIASDAVKLMDLGPIGDQMSEDLKFIQPPVMQQARQAKDGKVDPKQLAQENAQLKQQLQHAEQAMEQEHQAAQGKQAELASKEKIAGWEIDSKERIAALDRETKITVAELGAKVDRLQLFLEERGRIGAHLQDQASQASDQFHEHVQGEIDRTHQVGMAAAGAAVNADEANAQRVHGAVLQDAAQQHAGEMATIPPPQPEGAGA